MRVKLLTTISLFTYQLSVSQTEKLLHGKVVAQDLPLKNVEVINKTAKISTRTNESGEFSISVNIKDSLLFFSKDFLFTRLKVTAENIQSNRFTVNMIAKPEELKEVVVLNKESKTVWLTKEEIEQIKLNAHKSKEGLKIAGYKEAVMPNGTDFIYLGKQIRNLFKKEETPKKESPKIDLNQLIKSTLNPDFLTKELKLKPEETALFIEFCEADPKSNTLLENPNILATMDFLYSKNEEFKKLR
ncbi:hypothetical protein [Flavobacterium chungangense]|uniref:Uncharacterized protein n=1 Tax=Flavobacterium chungangense TaxID=554283 RepID=A0A6V6YVP9_9FLAO|nr:hypothetical protein [Flavobacterium chungangense]CAD0003570.1 hypothetical protein FLACHUCJ7_01473 [Flavobacterium chungangense]